MSELKRLIAALSEVAAYPEPIREVELVQTQMSAVFLAGEYAYKIKKPVDLGYVDYTLLERRRYFCEREIVLNRRLCPGAYLGVVPITLDGHQLVMEGMGHPVEYAVKMRRLPGEQLLDKLLKQDKVTPEMMALVASRLVSFHLNAATDNEITRYGLPEAITRNAEENFAQTEKYIGQALSRKQWTMVRDYTQHFIQENSPLFARRLRESHIRDCHGDLHAQHICFCHDLCIFDCIEFNDRFRYSDTAAEVAFLAMDLERNGRADLADHFVAAYTAESRDGDLVQLMSFYKGYRAYVRGKVNCFKLDDPCMPESDRLEALATAQGYFDLAAAYARPRPLLVAMMGFVGSGKTTTARELAGRLGAIYLSSDITRKKLAGIPLTEHCYRQGEDGLYSDEFTRRTYDALYREAADALSQGHHVILDGAFLKARERAASKEVAVRAGADYYALECRTAAETIRKRLIARLTQDTISDGHWGIYLKQQAWFEAPEPGELGHIAVDTSQPLAQNVRWVLIQVLEV